MLASKGQKLGKKKTKNHLGMIGEILGILQESGKSKDWILREVKRHKIKCSITPTMNSFEMLKSCSPEFLSHALHVLKDDDFEIKGISTLTRTFHWFFTDIVGSANPAVLTKDQAQKVWALNELLGRTDTFRNRDEKLDVLNTTGDGMVIGFHDSPDKPLLLAIELHKLLSRYNQSRKGKDKLAVRIGIDTGPVFFIKDVTGKDNVWGSGIIMARRVMDLARPMQILASARIANNLNKLHRRYKEIIHPIGDYKIKHGEKLSVFNIYGEGLGNMRPPNRQDSKDIGDESDTAKFLFPKVELKLELKDIKTMMTHHSWIWNAVNITDTPIDHVSYYLEGDVDKEFADLNVKITDENNTKLKMLSLDVNMPKNKQFIIKLERPIKPGQKRRFLKLEYDWEEPKRNFLYTLSTDCKKFECHLIVPNDFEIKQRVLKVDIATKLKTRASFASQVRYLKGRTEVTWKASNLKAYDAYQFEW